MKNQTLTAVKYWIIMGSTALILFIFGIYIFLKARQTTSSTTDTTPSNIYTTAGETLTAAKRNTLVSNASAPALSQQYSANSVLTTTSTSWTDTDMSITMTTPAWHVLLLMNWSIWDVIATWTCWFIFNIDWNNITSSARWNTHINQNETRKWKNVSISWLADVSAWSHTFKVKRRGTSWTTCYMNDTVGNHNRQFQVIVLP